MLTAGIRSATLFLGARRAAVIGQSSGPPESGFKAKPAVVAMAPSSDVGTWKGHTLLWAAARSEGVGVIGTPCAVFDSLNVDHLRVVR